MEEAAQLLFRTWESGADYRWARTVWAMLPAADWPVVEEGRCKTESLIVLMSMALIYGSFAWWGFDEPESTPHLSTHEAMDLLRIEPFYLGQVYDGIAPTFNSGEVDLSEVVLDLATEMASAVVGLLDTRFPTETAMLRHFVYGLAPGQGLDNIPEEDRLDFVSISPVLLWISNRCQL